MQKKELSFVDSRTSRNLEHQTRLRKDLWGCHVYTQFVPIEVNSITNVFCLIIGILRTVLCLCLCVFTLSLKRKEQRRIIRRRGKSDGIRLVTVSWGSYFYLCLCFLFVFEGERAKGDKDKEQWGKSDGSSFSASGWSRWVEAALLRYTELSSRDPYPALHINCYQDMIKQGQPRACL